MGSSLELHPVNGPEEPQKASLFGVEELSTLESAQDLAHVMACFFMEITDVIQRETS